MKAKKINNLTLQITEKSGKIRNAGATKRTSIEEKKLWTAGLWLPHRHWVMSVPVIGYVVHNGTSGTRKDPSGTLGNG
jgi:hypothetical protein